MILHSLITLGSSTLSWYLGSLSAFLINETSLTALGFLLFPINIFFIFTVGAWYLTVAYHCRLVHHLLNKNGIEVAWYQCWGLKYSSVTRQIVEYYQAHEPMHGREETTRQLAEYYSAR